MQYFRIGVNQLNRNSKQNQEKPLKTRELPEQTFMKEWDPPATMNECRT